MKKDIKEFNKIKHHKYRKYERINVQTMTNINKIDIGVQCNRTNEGKDSENKKRNSI